MKSRIVAILPAYNQEKNIGRLIKQVRKYVSDIIVVTDGSIDNTAKVAVESGAIVPQPINKRGKGNAVTRGIESSRFLNPGFIVLMDSDGQHDPEEIPKLVQPLNKNSYDMVIGSRFMGIIKTSNINKIGNNILNLLHFLLTLKWLTDAESGFRAFKSEALYSLDLKATHYEIESDVLLEAINKKLKIKEVPITILKKERGINFLDGFRIANFIVKKKIIDFLK